MNFSEIQQLEAYACAIYVRWKLKRLGKKDDQQFFIPLVCAKARMTPIKGTTAPGSELSGFLILTRMLKVVIAAMDHKPSHVTPAVDNVR